MIDIPSNLVNGETVTFGGQKYIYKDGKLTPFIIKNAGTELPPFKLGVEVLTTERWINGKPIYTKVIDFGALPNTTTKNIAHGVTGHEYIEFTAISFTVVGGKYIMLPSKETTWEVHFSVNGANLTAITNQNFTVYAFTYVVLRYTKVADTSGSPVAAIAPVIKEDLNLAQETSAGFRRNGKDVYMMEVDFGALPNATSKSVSIPGYNAAYKYWLDLSNSYISAPDTGDTYPLIVPGIASLTHGVNAYINLGNIVILTGLNRTTQTAKVVLLYTK